MGVEPARLPLLRGILGIAATIVIFAGLKLGTEIVSPVFMGLFLALLLGPLYGWLKRHLPRWLALISMLVGLIILFGFLFYLFALAGKNLQTGLATYATQIQTNAKNLQASLQSIGLNSDTAGVNSEALIAVLTAVISAIVGVVVYLFPVLILCLFFISEGEVLFKRAQESLPNNPVLMRLSTFGSSVARQFALRGIVNAITGAGFAILLLLLGVDYAVLWGVLTFFLSYIPYIGIVVAGAPAVILAFAEFGIYRAIAVVLALALVNVSAENILSPALMGRGLNLSTSVTFIGFMFWLWLLGGPGAFLAMPLTILVILILDSFPETRWLAGVAMRTPEAALTPQGVDNSPNTTPNQKQRK